MIAFHFVISNANMHVRMYNLFFYNNCEIFESMLDLQLYQKINNTQTFYVHIIYQLH